MPNQRIKKKSLRASEVYQLLKIEGFGGTITAPTPQKPAVQSQPTTAHASTIATKPLSSFSIKDAIKQSALQREVPTQQITHEERITENKPFDVPAVEKVLNEYASTRPGEKSLGIALRNHTPIVNGNAIVLNVDNNLLLDCLRTQHATIRNTLMHSLRNSNITLDIHITNDTNDVPQLCVTSKDKLIRCIELYPKVKDLIQILDLHLE